MQSVALTADETLSFNMAVGSIKEAMKIYILSLRLTPVLYRDDIWSPSAWRDHGEVRRIRKEQWKPMAARLNALPKEALVILGGDFNAPAGDPIFRMLNSRYINT